ncbi:hypothetical protein X474_05450 [Dethiosulfatarculus sandiegensis]|uniref:Uncharacterized protein n=2 Tax=Dethiosulfatarculus sandiegensis TaxID=1429043 RepID=A0A0D2JHL2_9BACT|nr:hypothetical protein X474_05450 [Dethiosulfatarculus sandiegensis]
MSSRPLFSGSLVILLRVICLAFFLLYLHPPGSARALEPQPGEALMPSEDELPGWKKLKVKRFKPGGMHTWKEISHFVTMYRTEPKGPVYSMMVYFHEMENEKQAKAYFKYMKRIIRGRLRPGQEIKNQKFAEPSICWSGLPNYADVLFQKGAYVIRIMDGNKPKWKMGRIRVMHGLLVARIKAKTSKPPPPIQKPKPIPPPEPVPPPEPIPAPEPVPPVGRIPPVEPVTGPQPGPGNGILPRPEPKPIRWGLKPLIQGESCGQQGELRLGEVKSPLMEVEWARVEIPWQGKSFKPARCDKQGRTLFHLWLDHKNQPVSNRKTLNELYTLLFFLNFSNSKNVADTGHEFYEKAQNLKKEEEKYVELATWAMTTKVASQITALYLTGKPEFSGSFWQMAGSFLAVNNAYFVLSNYSRLFSKEQNPEKIKENLKNHRGELVTAYEKTVGVLKTINDYHSYLDVAVKGIRFLNTAKPVMLSNSAAFYFAKGYDMEMLYEKTYDKVAWSAAGLVWSLLNAWERTDLVCKGAVELALWNRAAYFHYMLTAQIYEKAAQGILDSIDDVLILQMLVPGCHELRAGLLKQYAGQIRQRKGYLSGLIYFLMAGESAGKIFRKLDQGLADNRSLREKAEEHFDRAVLAVELESAFNYFALKDHGVIIGQP